MNVTEEAKRAFGMIPPAYLIVAGVLLAVALACGIAGLAYGVADWKSRRALEKVQDDAAKKINEAETVAAQARQDQAKAEGRVTELEAQLAQVDVAADKQERSVATARETTKEAKTKYEATKKTTTVNDARPGSVKREELRARYARRGIVVTEN